MNLKENKESFEVLCDMHLRYGDVGEVLDEMHTDLDVRAILSGTFYFHM